MSPNIPDTATAVALHEQIIHIMQKDIKEIKTLLIENIKSNKETYATKTEVESIGKRQDKLVWGIWATLIFIVGSVAFKLLSTIWL